MGCRDTREEDTEIVQVSVGGDWTRAVAVDIGDMLESG